jgi:hypothetical protein
MIQAKSGSQNIARKGIKFASQLAEDQIVFFLK